MVKYKDVTQTGPKALKGVRNPDLYSKNNPLDSDFSPEQLQGMANTAASSKIRNYDVSHGHIGYEGLSDPSLYKPTPVSSDSGLDDYGNSRFDNGLIYNPTQEDITNQRAANEPWYDKIGAGIAKGAVLAGTTFINGPIGLLVGGALAIAEGRVSAIWDNPLSNAMYDINKGLEDALPNYYSTQELEAPWYSPDNIFTANFLGDKVIKVLGFSIGAYYGGALGSAGMSALAATKAGSVVMGAASNLAKTMNIVKDASLFPSIVTSGIGATISAVGEGSQEAISNSKDWFNLHKVQLDDSHNQRLKAIAELYWGTEMYDKLISEENNAYNQTLGKLSEDRLKMGNADFLMNIPVLMASNLILFGKMYANGFKTARKATNIVGKAGEYTATSSKLGGALSNIKGALSEGNEEVLQLAASNISGDYYSTDVHNFYKAKTDPKAAKETLSWTKAFAEGINQTVNDGSTWELFMIGSLIGAMGMPKFRNVKDALGNIQSPITFLGGAFGLWKDYNEARVRDNQIADYMNLRVNSPEFKNYYQGLIRHNKYLGDMNAAAENNDEFSYKNAEHALLVSDVAMFDNAGKLDDLNTLINSAYDTSDENLQSIVKNTTKTTKDGKKVGPFVDDNGNPMYGKKGGKKEMIDKLTKSKEDMTNTISNYTKIKDSIDVRTGLRLSDDLLEELTWMKSLLGDWANRAEDMTGEIKTTIGTVIGDLSTLVGFNQKVRDYEGKHHAELTDTYRKTDANLLLLLKVMATLKEVQGSTSSGLVATLASNPKFVTGLKDSIDEIDDQLMNADDKLDVKGKLDDIVKLGNASKTYNSKLKEYLASPDKLAEQHAKATELNIKDEMQLKVTSLKEGLSNATNLSEFKDALDKAEDDDIKLLTLLSMEEDGSELAKNYRETSLYSADVKRTISSMDVDPATKEDANKLLQDHINNSENLQDIANPQSVHINNESAFDEDSEGDLEESARRFKEALYLALTAMAKVNNDDKFKNRFSPEYKKPVDVVRQTTKKDGVKTTKYRKRNGDKIISGTGLSINKDDIPASELESIEGMLDDMGDTAKFELLELREKDGKYAGTVRVNGLINGAPVVHNFEFLFDKNPDKLRAVRGDDRTTTGDSGTSTIPSINGLGTSPLTATPIGDITHSNVVAENTANNDKLAENNTPNKEGNRKYYRPAIPELHIEASKEGDFRPFNLVVAEREKGLNFDAIYNYLKDVGAFDYLNEGKLSAGNELGFMIDPEFNDHTIFIIDKRNNLIVGSLDESEYSVSRYEGLAGLEDKIKLEFKASNSNTKFIATPTIRVSLLMVGRIPYGTEERSLNDIPNVKSDESPAIFGIIKNGTLSTNSKINDSEILKPVDMSKKEGRMYLLIKNGKGTYSPAAVRVKHFNAKEFNLKDATVSETPMAKHIAESINKLASVLNNDDLTEAVKTLGRDLYIGDVHIDWVSSEYGNAIRFTKVERDALGREVYTNELTPQGKRKRKELVGLVFITTKDEVQLIFDSNGPATAGTPEIKSTEEIATLILDVLWGFNLPILVNLGMLNEGGYNNMLIGSNILTSNISNAKVQSTWFTTDYFDSKGELHTATSPTSITPQAAKKVETPVGGKEGVINGILINTAEKDTLWVNLKSNSIIDKLGVDITKNYSKELILVYLEQAWALNLFGDKTEASIMTDNKVITPSGKVLNRSTGAYLTDSLALKVKDAIANKEKATLTKVADSKKVIGKLYENQKKVNKTMTDENSYYIMEDDGLYHPYTRVHGVLGSNWIESPKLTEALTNVRTNLSKFSDNTTKFDIYLAKIGKHFEVDLSPFMGKTDIRNRNTIVNIIRDKMSGTNSLRALNAGTAVDSIIRNFFTSNLAPVKPANMTSEAFNSLISRLTEIRSNIEQTGERFLADNIVLYQHYLDGTRIAGEVDILSVDKEGNFKIYDVKTSRYSFYNFRDKYGHTLNYFRNKSRTMNMSSQDYYTLLLSAYKNLFESQYRTPINTLAILPFVLSYNKDDISGVTGEKGIPITYNPAVKVPLVSAVTATTSPIVPIFNSTLETQKPKNLILPEYNLSLAKTTRGYFMLDGVITNGYIAPIGKVGDTEVYMTKVPNMTRGLGSKGEAHVASNSYYAVFPNGLTVKILANSVNDTDESAATKIFEALKANSLRVADESSVETPIQKIANASVTKSNSAAITILAEQAIMPHDAEFENDELRLVDSTSNPIWDLKLELDWLNKNLPLMSLEDRVKVVSGLIKVASKGALAWGLFSKGVITLSDIAAKGTVYHEAFHVVFHSMMEEPERIALLKEASTIYGSKSNRALEEDMAEGFREYVMDRVDAGLGKRIIQFFKDLYIKVTNWNKVQPHLIAYYQLINKGKYVSSTFKNSSITRDRVIIDTKELEDIINKAPRNSKGQLLAPNKEVSHLNERQYAQVRTKAFKEWFGDWENNPLDASKVVDENGEPLVVYHGSDSYGFNIFDPSKSDDKISLFASSSKWVASTYTSFKPLENTAVKSALLKGNAIDLIKNKDWKSLETLINSVIDSNLPRPTKYGLPLPYGNKEALNKIHVIKEELLNSNLSKELHLSLLADLTAAEDEYYYLGNYNFKVEQRTIRGKNQIRISILDSYNAQFSSTYYTEGGVLFRGSPEELINTLTFDTKVYDLFFNIRNPLILDNQYNEYSHANNWNNLNFAPAAKDIPNRNIWGELMSGTHKQTKTRDVAAYAKEHGYDGVIFKQIADRGGNMGYDTLSPETEGYNLYADTHIDEDSFDATSIYKSDIFIAFNSNQIKSATDNIGGFSTQNDDIRYREAFKMQDILNEASRDSKGNLLAPNGKKSNLTEKQYAQVRTKAFKDWFGDWEKATNSNRVSLGKEIPNTDEYSKYGQKGETDVEIREVLDENDNIIGTVRMEFSGKGRKGVVTLHPNLTVTGKGYGTALYQHIADIYNINVEESFGEIGKSEAAKKLWNKIANTISKDPDIPLRQLTPSNSSKVVDENGEPLVVYHGTNFEFNSFSKDKRGSYTKAKSATLAFFAASNIKNAEKYLVSESERFQPFRRKDGSEDLYDVFEKQLQENQDDIREAIYKRELELEKDPLFQIEELKNKYGDGYNLYLLTNPEFAKKYPEQAKLYKKEVDKIEDKLLLKINPHIKSMFLNIRNPKIDDDKNTGHRANSYDERISDALQEGKDGGVIKNTRDPLDTDIYYFFEQNQAKSATDNTGTFNAESDDIRYREVPKVTNFTSLDSETKEILTKKGWTEDKFDSIS